MAPHMQASLVCDALRMAIGARQPQLGLLMHTDRGSQYASQAHTELLGAYGLEQSMSRKGNCWDNAVCGRFFLNLKMERVWQGQYANHGEAQRNIADYIVNFYNAQRLHSWVMFLPTSSSNFALQLSRKPTDPLFSLSICPKKLDHDTDVGCAATSVAGQELKRQLVRGNSTF